MTTRTAWFNWWLSFLGNSFASVLWLVFGLAGAGNSNSWGPEIYKFLAATTAGAVLPQVASLYFMNTRKLKIATLCSLATVPVMVILLHLL